MDDHIDGNRPDAGGGTVGESGIPLRTLFDEMPHHAAVLDGELRILDQNRKSVEAFGDHRSEFCYRAYRGRTKPCPECLALRAFADGKEHSAEDKIFDAAGIPYDVLAAAKPLFGSGGNVAAVMETFTDITETKEIQIRLNDGLEKYRSLFEQAPGIISVHDREYRIVEGNSRFRKSFGARPGRYCYEIYRKRESRCENCPVAMTFADGRVHRAEEVVLDVEERRIHVVVHTAPVKDSRGITTAVMKVATDITELKMLKDRLAVLGQLVGGTAHSIKNVLEGLRGGMYIVNLGFKSEKQEDVKEGWEMVQRNIGRISNMIMDMLYCARDRSRRRVAVDLGVSAREVLNLFDRRAKDEGVELILDAPETPCEIQAEPKDIHALLSNIVTNALDACRADADETKKHRVTVRVRMEGDNAVVGVGDTGVGMDRETRSRLFTMLYSTKGSMGTGLGLLVSRKVVEEHGGGITVESEPGKGAVFTVTLPVDYKPDESEAFNSEQYEKAFPMIEWVGTHYGDLV